MFTIPYHEHADNELEIVVHLSDTDQYASTTWRPSLRLSDVGAVSSNPRAEDACQGQVTAEIEPKVGD